MPNYLPAFVLGLIFTSNCLAQTAVESIKCSNPDFTHVLACYRQALATEPLSYTLLSEEKLPGLTRHRYQLTSQHWSPENLVSPATWQHQVDIFIPDNSTSTQALVVVNNGTNYSAGDLPAAEATDFSTSKLAEIARATETVVLVINNVPNQYLEYQQEGTPRKEDYSVARSWTLFMDAPETRATLPLHIPMTAAVSQAMTLAQQALPLKALDSFIVTGLSKRGWTTWLSAIADPRVEAIVPFVIDLLGTRDGLDHMYQSYGGNWPIAFYPYYQEEIDKKIKSVGFTKLMQVSDPLQYIGTEYETRLSIPKYIINASGDDFYVPDNTDFYYDKLPGIKVLRVAPNSNHYGITAFSEQSLITFVNRFKQSTPLPEVNVSLDTQDKAQILTVSLSETPDSVLLWTASNPDARDFRYACDIKYSAFPLAVTSTNTLEVALTAPAAGWQATFVEATFSDGFVATTPVYILPKALYPTVAPANIGQACKTLPGRSAIADTTESTVAASTVTQESAVGVPE